MSEGMEWNLEGLSLLRRGVYDVRLQFRQVKTGRAEL
jgi:hypothetical protein